MARPSLPELPPVTTFTVAPHRYLWNAPASETVPCTYREVKTAAPYKAGEVIYVVDGDGYRRAYIVHVTADRDRYDEWREYYEVRPETKNGTFAKRSYKAYPGFVQRGYQRALGLDDMDRETEAA
jgi:hypothetical protein